MTAVDERAVDPEVLNAFMGKFVQDLGAAAQVPTIIIGDRLGLYAALDELGPSTSGELAEATGTHERYIREWLRGQAAGGYVAYDAEGDRFFLTPEQSFTLAQPDSPAAIAGGFLGVAAAVRAIPRLIEAFTSGEGVGWHEHDRDLFEGTERFFRSGYLANLTSSWLPALDGVVDTLTAGGLVADVGCGHGASTILMAQTFPASRFVGFDYHAASIEQAAQRAAAAGVVDRCDFRVASAAGYPGTGYDLVAFFDCLHDMGDPLAAARHVHSTLRPGGCWMVVEPYANDSFADNINPVGRIMYNFSTAFCVPNSLSQETGTALGGQAGEAPIREIAAAAGFASFRRATETPFNIVYEARA